jgi:hypothetical protein
MAEEQKNIPSAMNEVDIPTTWQDVKVEPVTPGVNPSIGGALHPNDMPPYFQAVLNPDMQHDTHFVGTSRVTPQIAVTPLMPPGVSASPQNNANIQSIVKTVVGTAAPDSDPYMFFRGPWSSSINYNVNDVVIFNNSSYICTQANINSEPDSPVAPTVTVRQSAIAGNSGAGSIGVGFTNSVLPGSAIIVSVMSQNVGTNAAVAISDSMGSTYTLIALSPQVDSNQDWTAMYIALNVTGGGSVSVTATWPAGDSGPGFKDCAIAEVIGLGPNQPDSSNTVGVRGSTVSFPAPAYTVQANSTSDLIFTCALSDAGSLTAPAGFTSTIIGSPPTTAFAGIAWAPPLFAGPNVIAWGGIDFRFCSVAASLKPAVNTSAWTLIGENAVFNVPPSATQFNPYEVVLFEGSMYVCLKPTTMSPFAAPGNWALWAQGAGGVVNNPGNYTPLLGDDGRLIFYSSSSNQTLTLPNPPFNNGWWIAVQNVGTGVLTLNRNGTTINNFAGNGTLNQNQGVLIYTDGTNYFTLNGFATVTNSGGALTNHAIIIGNGGNDIRALGSLGTTTTVLHGNAAGDPSFGSVVENDQLLSDVTTDNVSTSMHGYAPKLPGDATKFLNGAGAYTSAFPPFLAVAEAIGTLITHSVSGTLRLAGNVIPPAGVYRVSGFMRLAANPSAGSLNMAITANDGVASYTDSNGTDGAPLNVDTSALNKASGTMVIVSDGIHDITWTMTLT